MRPDLLEGVLYVHHFNTQTHFLDTLLGNPCVHVLWPTVYQSAFPKAAY